MIKDSVIIITGASRGIGKAMAFHFSKLGAKIVLAARSKNTMLEFSKKLPGEYLVVKTDVCSEKSVKNMINQTIKKFGRIDVLINNAGHGESLSVFDTTTEIWENIIKTNLTGSFITTRETLVHMKKTGGRIVFIASTAGMGSRPEWAAYAASKAGVINFAMSMSRALESYGVKVFCISPAGTDTDLRKKLVPDEDPLKIMKPKDVVNVVEYCLTDEGDAIEGQPIIVKVR